MKKKPPEPVFPIHYKQTGLVLHNEKYGLYILNNGKMSGVQDIYEIQFFQERNKAEEMKAKIVGMYEPADDPETDKLHKEFANPENWKIRPAKFLFNFEDYVV